MSNNNYEPVVITSPDGSESWIEWLPVETEVAPCQ